MTNPALSTFFLPLWKPIELRQLPPSSVLSGHTQPACKQLDFSDQVQQQGVQANDRDLKELGKPTEKSFPHQIRWVGAGTTHN